MAMFVLIVDTCRMNVSISSVFRDRDSSVSGVQSVIALEALVRRLHPQEIIPGG